VNPVGSPPPSKAAEVRASADRLMMDRSPPGSGSLGFEA